VPSDKKRLAKLQSRPRYVVLDWDGTCVPQAWPERPTDWLPGAEQAIKDLLNAGFKVVIHSTRTHELDVDFSGPNPDRDENIAYIRDMLDRSGFQEVQLATDSKPPAVAYVDDRAIPFLGDWKPITDQIIFQTERHPNSARFHELLIAAGQLHDKKQSDYGKGSDPFANVRGSTDWGMPAWVGAMVRATDKINRLQTFATRGSLTNESVVDSFMDLAVYALIGLVLYEEEMSGGK